MARLEIEFERCHPGSMPNTTANPVRLARLQAGLTIVEVAAKGHLSLATLWAAERGALTERTAERLAKVFDVPPEQLIPSRN